MQLAITLDSLGRNKEAYAIYRAIERSNAPGVAKAAKRMLFGWEASNFLKANTMSFEIKREWDPYFTRLTGQWNNTYVADPEDERGNMWVTVLALLVMVTPILLVGAKVLLS